MNSKLTLKELDEIFANFYGGVKDAFEILNTEYKDFIKECKEAEWDDEPPCINASKVNDCLKKLSEVANTACNKYNKLCDQNSKTSHSNVTSAKEQ